MKLLQKISWYSSVIFKTSMKKPSGKYSLLIAFLFLIEDIILLNLLFFSIYKPFHLNGHQLVLVLINLGYILSFAIVRADFSDVRQLHAPNLIKRDFYKLAITAFIVLFCLFSLKVSGQISRLFIFTFFCSAYVLMVIGHWITRKAVTFIVRKNINKGIILGAGRVGEKFFEELLCNIYNGVVILGFFDDNSNQNKGDVIGTIEEAKKFASKNGVTHVFCTLPLSAEEKIVDFIKFSESHVINFHIVPSIGYYYSGDQVFVEQVGKMPVFALRRIPLSYPHNAFMKRGFDIVLATIFLTTVFPIILLIASILIRSSSPGSIFFVQKRTGKKGKEFNCYKFRTMCSNNEADTKQATYGDKRITPVGNFLRKTSIDELPQFYNVLKGNMSIVGPRPHMLLHTDEYSPKVDKYMVRHFIKPGITGLAQVNGYRGETKEVEHMENRIKEDIKYVENWSLGLDVKIIAKTALLAVKGDKKAY